MKITFSRSVKILEVGDESWNRAGIEDEVKETETSAEAWERVVKEIYGVHEKYSKSFTKTSGDMYFNVSKNKEERG